MNIFKLSPTVLLCQSIYQINENLISLQFKEEKSQTNNFFMGDSPYVGIKLITLDSDMCLMEYEIWIHLMASLLIIRQFENFTYITLASSYVSKTDFLFTSTDYAVMIFRLMKC